MQLGADGDLFSANLVHFVRHLRDAGLAVRPATAGDLAQAALAVGLERRDDLYHAFRSLVVSRPADVPVFDAGFDRFFGGSGMESNDPAGADRGDPANRGGTLRASVPILMGARPDVEEDTAELQDVVGGSHAERLGKRDFATLTPTEHEQVRRLIAAMVWRPADAASRRWGPARAGSRPDLRRTLRAMTRPEGDLLPMAFAARRPRRRPLVVIADISGSMERYSEMFLHFIHAAQGRLGRVEAFVFATRLTRITREMRTRDSASAIARVAAAVDDWSGGTRIGEVLQDFNRDWGRRVTRGGAIGLVISDGWDTGDPAVLAHEMGRLSRSVHRLVWLNPLAGREGFAPETRGMRAALPYVDDFVPASNILDLADVVRLLESIPPARGSARGTPRRGAAIT